jgi:chromosomal replication initiator protein
VSAEPEITAGIDAVDAAQALPDPLLAFLRASTDFGSREQFWQAVQQGIKDRLGQERFSIWFRQTELMGGDEARLVVGVPNVVIQQFLTAQYARAVAATVEDLVGRPMAVSFDVAPRLFRQMRASQGAEAEQSPAAEALPSRLGTPKAPPEWGFDALICCRANRLPFAAARELAGQENPRLRFLYVCGDYGVGKSALLRAVYAMASAPERGMDAVLMTAEDWCNEYYHAIQRRTTHLFRGRYRACQMLILDDIQFIEGKAAGQGELLHTVKHILDRGGRVALGGVPHPDELKDVDPGLQALLRSAFPAVLVPPDEDERADVARQLALRKGLDAVKEVHGLVGERHGHSFRAMEAAVCRLVLYAGVAGCGKMELAAAREAFLAMRPATAEPVTVEQIRGRSRSRTVCRARHLAIYLTGRLTDASLTEIGRAFGGVTHSSVKHATDKIAAQCKDDPQLAGLVERLHKKLGGS